LIAGAVVRCRTDVDELLTHGITNRNDESRTGPPR
jgi:hypothetical protein